MTPSRSTPAVQRMHCINHLRIEIGKEKRPAHPEHHTSARRLQQGAMTSAIKRRWTFPTRRAIPPRALVCGARMTQTRAICGNGTRMLERTRACKRGKCSMDAMDRGSVHALRAQLDVQIELAYLHVVVPSAKTGGQCIPVYDFRICSCEPNPHTCQEKDTP